MLKGRRRARNEREGKGGKGWGRVKEGKGEGRWRRVKEESFIIG